MNAGIPVLIAAALAGAAAVGGAHGTIYKCRLDAGVFYQDSPCPPGRELRDFDKDPANVSVVPFASPSEQGARPPVRAPSRRATANAAPARSTAAKPDKPRKAAERSGEPAQRKFLRPGMSEGEVVARVGPPDMTSSRNRKGSRWTYMPAPEDANTITNLQFDNGRLTDVERKVIR